MTKQALITTSWDDGHETDLRLAALLHKYGLKGTFYIPRRNPERSVMKPSQMLPLAKEFEIGGHTLNHVRLTTVDSTTQKGEINGCYAWLSEVINKKPESFCFPGGLYNRHIIDEVHRAGFRVLRTTELHQTKAFVDSSLMPTTVQCYEHSYTTHAKHLLKRKRALHFVRWLVTNRSSDIQKQTTHYLKQVENDGGCFHLWGHSWEIDQYNLWQKLEEIFKTLSASGSFLFVENRHAMIR